MHRTCRLLDVLIVGAGLGGLATALALQKDGHRVRVVDAVAELAESGAGIHVPANASRLLMRWGVDTASIRRKSTSSGFHLVRWRDGTSIARVPIAEESHGAPYWLMHRADLQAALVDATRKAGVEILTSKRIVAYDFDAPSATDQDGKVHEADLIVCADGIKSPARPMLTGRSDTPRDTGDVAYRILISGERLMAEPDLAALITSPCATLWCGPGGHMVGYPIREGELYNVVICGSDNIHQNDDNSNDNSKTSDDVWVVKGDNRELRKRFAEWEPRVQKLCALTGEFMKWRLCDLPTLDRWVHPAGKAVLLGDSCHPMLPYLAQGAAQAFEDVAALRQCLRLCLELGNEVTDNNDDCEEETTTPGLKAALTRYQAVRMPRASLIQAKTREHQYIWHIDDGIEQQERDRLMKINGPENPVFWAFDERRAWLYSHDAEDLDIESGNW